MESFARNNHSSRSNHSRYLIRSLPRFAVLDVADEINGEISNTSRYFYAQTRERKSLRKQKNFKIHYLLDRAGRKSLVNNICVLLRRYANK